MLDGLNITPEQTERLARAREVLGDETAMRFVLDELLWAALDVSRILRPGSIRDPKRQEKVLARLGFLRVKTEVVMTAPWVEKQRMSKALDEALLEVERIAGERSKTNERRNSNV